MDTSISLWRTWVTVTVNLQLNTWREIQRYKYHQGGPLIQEILSLFPYLGKKETCIATEEVLLYEKT